MVAVADWSAVTAAGAFVLGATLATIAVLRVVRAVAVMFRQERHRDRDDLGAWRIDPIAVLELLALILVIVWLADKIWPR